MQSRGKYLLKNVVSFALGKLGTKMISFLLVPIYTYSLTTKQYGTIDLVATLCTVLMPMLVLNVSEAIMRFCLDKNADQKKIMSIGMLVLFVGSLIGLLLIPLLNMIPSLSAVKGYVYGYVISAAYAQVFLGYLRGQEKVTAYSIGNIIHTATAASLNILFLVKFEWGVSGYFLAYIFANAAVSVYAAFMGRIDKVIKNFHPDYRLGKEMLRFSTVLIPNSFMWWIINSSDRVMISAMVGTAANGIYAIAYKIPSLLSALTETFNWAWSYSAIREKSSVDAEEYHNFMYNNMVQVLVIVTAGLLLFIKPFLSLYVASEYYAAWRYTPYLLIGFMFMSLGTFLSTAYTVHKDSFAFLLSGMVGAGVNILLNSVLIPFWGVDGAALATCVSYMAVYVFRVFNTRRYIKIHVFQVKHFVCYGLLLTMGGLLFWDHLVSIILQILLFVINVYLSRGIVQMLFLRIKKKVKNGKQD